MSDEEFYEYFEEITFERKGLSYEVPEVDSTDGDYEEDSGEEESEEESDGELEVE
jgi:hypothetical protein